MISLVIDASVAIKWVVEEHGTVEALALRQFRLLAPDLLVAECADILWNKVRRKELTEREALLYAEFLEQADVELIPMRPMLDAAVQLAMALGHPACDCFYLACARSAGVPFVTADERLCAKARSWSLDTPVVALADTSGDAVWRS